MYAELELENYLQNHSEVIYNLSDNLCEIVACIRRINMQHISSQKVNNTNIQIIGDPDDCYIRLYYKEIKKPAAVFIDIVDAVNYKTYSICSKKLIGERRDYENS